MGKSKNRSPNKDTGDSDIISLDDLLNNIDDQQGFSHTINALQYVLSLVRKPHHHKTAQQNQQEIVAVIQASIQRVNNHPTYRMFKASGSLHPDDSAMYEHVKHIVDNTPDDAENIEILAFDTFYQTWLKQKIHHPGTISYPKRQNKLPKKVIVQNLPELTNTNFIERLLSGSGIGSIGRAQFQKFKELDHIKGVIFVGGAIQKYYALVFHTQEEKCEAQGVILINYIDGFFENKEIDPDLSITNTAYIQLKCQEYKIKIPRI